MLRLYLVRHGVTTWNREMRMQGHTDIPLDPDGEVQALKIASRIAAFPDPPQAIWSSDLQRARKTAEAIARPLGLTVETTPLLRETMLGDWEGLTREEIEARGDGALLRDYLRDSYRYRPPGSETLDAVWDRMVRAEALIRRSYPAGQVAIVGHGGSLRALICSALEAPITSMRRLWLDNASLTIIEQIFEEDISDPANVAGQDAFSDHNKEDAGNRENDNIRDTRESRVTLLNDTSHLLPASPAIITA